MIQTILGKGSFCCFCFAFLGGLLLILEGPLFLSFCSLFSAAFVCHHLHTSLTNGQFKVSGRFIKLIAVNGRRATCPPPPSNRRRCTDRTRRLNGAHRLVLVLMMRRWGMRRWGMRRWEAVMGMLRGRCFGKWMLGMFVSWERRFAVVAVCARVDIFGVIGFCRFWRCCFCAPSSIGRMWGMLRFWGFRAIHGMFSPGAIVLRDRLICISADDFVS